MPGAEQRIGEDWIKVEDLSSKQTQIGVGDMKMSRVKHLTIGVGEENEYRLPLNIE